MKSVKSLAFRCPRGGDQQVSGIQACAQVEDRLANLHIAGIVCEVNLQRLFLHKGAILECEASRRGIPAGVSAHGRHKPAIVAKDDAPHVPQHTAGFLPRFKSTYLASILLKEGRQFQQRIRLVLPTVRSTRNLLDKDHISFRRHTR
jgi:hypothetical protein